MKQQWVFTLMLALAIVCSLPGLSRGTSGSMVVAKKLTKVEVQKGDGEATIVLMGDGPFSYEVKRLQGDRLVIDLANVTSLVHPYVLSIDHPLLTQIRIGRHPKKIRLVLDLLKESSYSIEPAHNQLRILLTSTELATVRTVAQKETHERFPQSANVSDRPVRRVPRARLESAPDPRPSVDVSVSLFGGLAIPFKTDLKQTDPTFMEDFTAKNLSLKTSASYGLKATAWKTPPRLEDRVNFGLELDVTRYSPDQKKQDVDASGSSQGMSVAGLSADKTDEDYTIIAVNFLIRVPIGVTEALPHGRWYPYAGVGVGGEIARSKLASGQKDTDTAVVRQLLAGVKVFFTRNIAFFTEYKNTYAKHSFEFGTTRDQTTANINHIHFGFAYHF